MTAMVLNQLGPIESSPLQRADWVEPLPAPGEVRLRVSCCAICRTDLHIIEGDLPSHRLPLVPGHQIVGVVDRAGEGATRFKIGQRIGAAWLRHADGTCRFCISGRENLCPESRY